MEIFKIKTLLFFSILFLTQIFLLKRLLLGTNIEL